MHCDRTERIVNSFNVRDHRFSVTIINHDNNMLYILMIDFHAHLHYIYTRLCR